MDNRPVISDLERFRHLDQDEVMLDLYVRDTSLVDWEKFLNFLIASSHWVATLSGPAGTHPIAKANIGNVLKRISTDDSVDTLNVSAEGVSLTSHFIDEGEIELNLSASTVRDSDQLYVLMDFMSDLSVALTREVKLTYEAPDGDSANALLLAKESGEVSVGPELV